MTWILIALAIAMIVGPVMMIRPSRSQQKQAALRTQASQMGLIVKLASSEAAEAKGAYYTLPVSSDSKKRLDIWALKKMPYSHDIHFCQNWDWTGKEKAETQRWSLIRQQLTALPESISGIGVNAIGVFCLWDEKYQQNQEKQALDEIKSLLTNLAVEFGYRVK